MIEQPLVSVLGLSMNHERYVEQAYTSVINQTHKNIEILYLDNASKDNTYEVADKIFRASGLPYLGIKQVESRGISANLNTLLAGAKGKYIAVLSGDDWWEPDNLEKKVARFEQNREYGMVYGNGYTYYEQTKEKRLFYETEQPSGQLFKKLLQGNLMIAASVVTRHEALKEVGFFDESSPVEDWELWLRIAEKFPIGYTHEPTVYSRITGNNLSSNINFMNKGFEYIFNKYAVYPEIRKAKQNIELAQAYQLASTQPGFKSLSYILKNYQWSIKYNKQVVRCLLGMIGIGKKSS
jgi:glycosyltransferase involved in cell wall biosynthesis